MAGHLEPNARTGNASAAWVERRRIEALRAELEALTASTIERSEALKASIKGLEPCRARTALLESTLRLLEKCREEAAALRQGLE